MRRAVLSDWKFFLENEEWLSFWARRFGEAAVRALAEVLRRTNWRQLERDGARTRHVAVKNDWRVALLKTQSSARASLNEPRHRRGTARGRHHDCASSRVSCIVW